MPFPPKIILDRQITNPVSWRLLTRMSKEYMIPLLKIGNSFTASDILLSRLDINKNESKYKLLHNINTHLSLCSQKLNLKILVPHGCAKMNSSPCFSLDLTSTSTQIILLRSYVSLKITLYLTIALFWLRTSCHFCISINLSPNLLLSD